MYLRLLSILVITSIPLTTIAQGVTTSDDVDGDGLLNTEEDRNGDGIVNTGETDPYNADTDRGGEADGSEIQNKRDPFDRTDDMTYDLDADGLTNGQEDIIGTDRVKPDTDNDSLNDRDDPFPLDGRYTKDTDKDGLPDEYEDEHSLQKDVRSDANDDRDNDGLTNLQEFIQGTDMNNADSDNDGETDGDEVSSGNDPLENPCLSNAGPTEVLHDLEGHWSKSYVEALQQTKIGTNGNRIIQGYSYADGDLFKPNQEISRYELLKIALLSSCIIPNESADEGDFEFPDVRRIARARESNDTTLKRRVIYTAYDLGIVDGYPDGSFKADAPINRAEALKILFLATQLPPFDDQSYENIFSDVTDDDWFAEYIHDALSYAFIEGYDDGTFKPGQSITRAEASKLVLYMTISNPRVNGYVVPVENIDL
ncbi:hypothetical protein COU75_00915 [Candidatus Peregrinibacteria bacterium CG10_big_fil_rev_8_21_14_0_10_42_8]|nr:MAG: hypothetical protein COU75_00915 [Candidatus Peregrinibacteria bacterium CG10_big_fil_rev_8_21_14_0_10_42_8]